jgi:hypothetical protein
MVTDHRRAVIITGSYIRPENKCKEFLEVASGSAGKTS